MRWTQKPPTEIPPKGTERFRWVFAWKPVRHGNQCRWLERVMLHEKVKEGRFFFAGHELTYRWWEVVGFGN